VISLTLRVDHALNVRPLELEPEPEGETADFVAEDPHFAA